MKFASTLLAFSVAALVSLGVVLMVSSELDFSFKTAAGRQLVFCGLGLLVAAVIALFDYRWLKSVSWFPYLIALGLLATVLVLWREVNGAARWLPLPGGFTFQPSELAKVALVIVLAHYGDRHQRHLSTWWRGIVLPGILMGGLISLVFLGKDYGASALLAAVGGTMLLVGGARWRHLLPVAVAGVLIFGALVASNPNRMKRVWTWLSPETASVDDRRQIENARAAFAGGGIYGKGLGQGEVYGAVPLVRSDFILSLVGEELGLVGTASVVLAYMLFVVAGIMIAWNATDTFGFLLAIGLTFTVGLQAMINIGVVTAVLPNKGITLPFLSQGGSNLVVMLALVGVLFSVARTSTRENPEREDLNDLDDLPSPQTP